MLATLAYVFFGLIEFVIGMRIVLLAIGANPASPFVAWIYSWSAPFVSPFAGVFGQHVVTAPGPGVVVQSVFDWTALIALVVYGLVAWLLGRAAYLGHPHRI